MDYVRRGAVAPDTVRYCYRHPEIKATLRRETFDKCAYCEAKIQHIDHGQTDHIRPVSRRPELLAAWENLTYACEQCNMAKSDYDSEAEPLINPYEVDPTRHITFYGPLTLNKAGDDLGYRTIRQLKLNRSALLDRRKDRLEQIQPLLDRWAAMPEGPTKELIQKQILAEADDDREFAALVRCFLHQAQGW